MAKKYPGFYLYYDWLDAMEHLPAKKAMTIIKNLSDYARYGTEPPPVEGHAGSLQTIFAAQLKRSMVNAENGRLGGAAGQKKASAAKENPPPESGADKGEAVIPRALKPEEIQAVGFLDYLKIKARFDAEEAASRGQGGVTPSAEGAERGISLSANPTPKVETRAEPTVESVAETVAESVAESAAEPAAPTVEAPSEGALPDPLGGTLGETLGGPLGRSLQDPLDGTSPDPWDAPWEEGPFFPI